MKYQKLSPVLLLIGLLCLADINGQTRRRQKRPSKKITRTNRVQFDLIYDFSVSGETSKIKFVTLLPKTIPDRQKILEIKYSTEPAKVFSENGNKYAEFVFVDPNESFKLKINVKANLARYDLSTAQRRYKENPPPNYPKVARIRGYEGSTRLKVEVLESGKVGRIEIASSSGFEVLDKAALESVKNWTFTPGTRSGENIRQWVMVPVRFSLR